MPSQRAIAPYWERFPSFFLYPFSMDGLPALLGFSALITLLSVISLIAPIVGLLMLGAWLMFIRHAFAVLSKTAQGFLGDSYAHDASHLDNWIGVKHGLAIVLATALVMVIALIGRPLAAIVGIVLLLAWPANVMRLAITGNLGESLNPIALLETIVAIGMPYLGLWGCLLMLAAGSATVQNTMTTTGGGFVPMVIAMVAGLYFTLVMFRLMGYVMYQYHVPLGIFVVEQDDPAAKPISEQDQILANCRDAVAAGKQDDALQILARGISLYPNDTSLLSARLKLQLAVGHTATEIQETADSLFNQFIGGGRFGQALDVLEQVAAVLPDFAPKRGHDAITLAKLAFNSRKTALATRLLKGFDKRYPKHSELPDAMLLAARVLCEHQRNDAQAGKVLDQLIRHFPDHPIRREAEQLLTVIQKLTSEPTASKPL